MMCTKLLFLNQAECQNVQGGVCPSSELSHTLPTLGMPTIPHERDLPPGKLARSARISPFDDMRRIHAAHAGGKCTFLSATSALEPLTRRILLDRDFGGFSCSCVQTLDTKLQMESIVTSPSPQRFPNIGLIKQRKTSKIPQYRINHLDFARPSTRQRVFGVCCV